MGLNFTDTSTSVYGPDGATMTLNSFLVARCVRTCAPLGAPAISSTAHWPWTVVQPSRPLVSKSNRSTGRLSGTLSSAGAARAEAGRIVRTTPSAAPAALRNLRRAIVIPLTLVELLGHRRERVSLGERDGRDRVSILERRDHADRAGSG